MHPPHATANCLSEIPQLLGGAPRAARAAHSRFVLTACSIHVLSEIPHLLVMFLLHDVRAARYARRALRAPHIRASRSRRLHRHVSFMYSRASRSFSFFALARNNCAAIIARAAHAMHTPTPITCGDCPNESLYQLGSRSVQPFGRQRWICSAARTFARAERA
jgi:hypothetical protein